jgi:hypothetical protein
MDRHHERFEQIAQRVFGPDARLAGTIGTATAAGELRILIGSRVFGAGNTFSRALQAAVIAAAELHVGERVGNPDGALPR